MTNIVKCVHCKQWLTVTFTECLGSPSCPCGLGVSSLPNRVCPKTHFLTILRNICGLTHTHSAQCSIYAMCVATGHTLKYLHTATYLCYIPFQWGCLKMVYTQFTLPLLLWPFPFLFVPVSRCMGRWVPGVYQTLPHWILCQGGACQRIFTGALLWWVFSPWLIWPY